MSDLSTGKLEFIFKQQNSSFLPATLIAAFFYFSYLFFSLTITSYLDSMIIDADNIRIEQRRT